MWIVLQIKCATFQQVHNKETELGIGQTSILLHRYASIDYLPSMFLYRFLVQSKKPEAINRFDTLVYPLDKYVWCCLALSVLAVFITLIFIQKCWILASGENPKNGWIFQGKNKMPFYYVGRFLKTHSPHRLYPFSNSCC